MSKFLLSFGCLLLIISIQLTILPFSLLAHGNKQAPFFKINSIYTEVYPVPTTSLKDFKLPQDIAVNPFLVNQPLHFELLKDLIPLPEEAGDQVQFLWDYGDQTQGEGLINDHSYTQPGSYFLTITAQYPSNPKPQLIQSVLINILPSKDYQLPTAVIEVNGQQSKDPLTDIIQADLSEETIFDSSKSNPGGSKIVEYLWDLGDQNSSTKARTTHRYTKETTQVFPVLRIKTADGFIADSFIEVQNDSNVTKSASADLPIISFLRSVIFAPLFILLLLGFIGALLWKVLLKQKNH